MRSRFHVGAQLLALSSPFLRVRVREIRIGRHHHQPLSRIRDLTFHLLQILRRAALDKEDTDVYAIEPCLSAEPVVGAALACAPAPDGYFQVIRDICDRYNVLFICDEVMTGFGRTGWLWGIDYWGVTPDIIAAAKGMTSGYTPLSAVIARDAVWQPLVEQNSGFKAGHTMNANAVSCAGGVAAINYLLTHKLVENARSAGDYFLKRLAMLLKHSIVGDVRGRGMMVGFELVANRQTKEPFPPRLGLANLVFEQAFKRGLVIYPCTGTVHGAGGDMILLAPPLITTPSQVDEIVAILDDTLKDVAREISK